MTDSLRANELRTVFPGESETAQRLRAIDWSRTDLGAPASWPENLRAAVRLCLTSRFPILLWWGRQLSVLYNDGGRELWAALGDAISPMLQSVMASGVAIASEDVRLFVDRAVAKEEVFVSLSFGPMLGADGQTVEGIFCPCAETTEKVVGARRLETLRKLAAWSRDARTLTAACEGAVAVLRENPRDVPFAALYVGDEREMRLVAGAMPREDHRLPATVTALDTDDSPWPLGQVLRSKEPVDRVDLVARGVRIPGGEWPEPTREAIVLPIPDAHRGLAGLLVAGVSPRRPLDAAYRAFFDLVAGYIGSAMLNARAYEAEQVSRVATMGEMASSIAHELNQPLAAIVANANACERWLARRPINVQGANAAVARIVRDATRASEVIARIRAFVQRREMQRAPLDVAEIVRETLAMIEADIRRHQVVLSVALAKGLPRVVGDRVHLQQVILNLLKNGIEAMESVRDRRRVLAVTVDTFGSDAVRVAVHDSGVGLEGKQRDRVFDAFHTTKPGGMGMGLAICRSIVEAHGGRIWVSDSGGPGATFQFTLPIQSPPNVTKDAAR
jgi:signal transduction histidine kinase